MNINLAPMVSRTRQHCWISACCLLAILGCFAMIFTQHQQHCIRENTKLIATLTAQQTKPATVTLVQLNELKKFQKTTKNLYQTVALISDIVPAGIILNNLKLSEKTLTLKGIAVDYTTENQFVTTLLSQSVFKKEVQLTMQQKKQLNFTLIAEKP